MLDQQQKQELERILKEIDTRSSLDGSTLYYKKRNGRLYRLPLEEHPYIYRRMKEIIFSPYIEYAVFIDFMKTIAPSRRCMVDLRFCDAIDQFFPMDMTFVHVVSGHMVDEKFVKNVLGVKPLADAIDPLSQIFTYRRTFLTQWPQHVYVCPYLYEVEPFRIDSTSIFNGKRGLVAYCMTLHDLVLTAVYKGGYYAFRVIEDLWFEALKKLSDIVRRVSYSQGIQKACDINFIKDIIHEEIEKADLIMRQYGLTRIAFLLD